MYALGHERPTSILKNRSSQTMQTKVFGEIFLLASTRISSFIQQELRLASYPVPQWSYSCVLVFWLFPMFVTASTLHAICAWLTDSHQPPLACLTYRVSDIFSPIVQDPWATTTKDNWLVPRLVCMERFFPYRTLGRTSEIWWASRYDFQLCCYP